MHLQASFAKWNEGQKDRPKQVNAALEAHKARIAAADAAAQQQKEAVTVRPVPKGKKEQPLELHPDQFVRIKAHKTAGSTSTSAAMLADLAEATASPAVDVEVNKQKSLHQHLFVVPHTTQCSSDLCVVLLYDYHIAMLQQYDHIYSNHLCTLLGVSIVCAHLVLRPCRIGSRQEQPTKWHWRHQTRLSWLALLAGGSSN